jgi:hypothetical protein
MNEFRTKLDRHASLPCGIDASPEAAFGFQNRCRDSARLQSSGGG